MSGWARNDGARKLLGYRERRKKLKNFANISGQGMAEKGRSILQFVTWVVRVFCTDVRCGHSNKIRSISTIIWSSGAVIRHGGNGID